VEANSNRADSHRLQSLCEYLVQTFVEAGLAPPQDRSVKLHATIMNSKYRQEQHQIDTIKNSKQSSNDNEQEQIHEREPFDATTILEQFGEYLFGEYKLNEVQLSDRFNRDQSTQYWKSVAQIKFP